MSRDTIAISAQLRKDSKLLRELKEYQDANSMTSKSEAIRHLLRAGLEAEHEQDDDRAPNDDDTSDAADTDNQKLDINLIRGNEPILAGLAYLIGSDGFLAATQAVAGAYWGSITFAAVGVAIMLSLIPMMYRAIKHISKVIVNRDDQANASGADV